MDVYYSSTISGTYTLAGTATLKVNVVSPPSGPGGQPVLETIENPYITNKGAGFYKIKKESGAFSHIDGKDENDKV